MKNILFIGTVDFSNKMLKHLIDLNANIIAVCTLKESKFNSDYIDLYPLCIKNNIPILKVKSINSSKSISWIKNKSPDIIFCFGISQIIKKEILSIPPRGIVGFHPAALPQNRGRHPLIWPLILGLKETASTFFFMDKGADSGNIISQEIVRISDNDNARSLYDKISKIAKKQVNEILPLLSDNNFKGTKQNHNLATYWRKRNNSDGRIDWRMDAKNIYNLVRGLSKPYIGAHFKYNNSNIKVWEVKYLKNNNCNIEPGKVINFINNFPVIKCGVDSIILINIDPYTKLKIGEYL